MNADQIAQAILNGEIDEIGKKKIMEALADEGDNTDAEGLLNGDAIPFVDIVDDLDEDELYDLAAAGCFANDNDYRIRDFRDVMNDHIDNKKGKSTILDDKRIKEITDNVLKSLSNEE